MNELLRFIHIVNFLYVFGEPIMEEWGVRMGGNGRI